RARGFPRRRARRGGGPRPPDLPRADRRPAGLCRPRYREPLRPRVTLRILHLDFHRGWGGQPSRILMGSRELARRGHEVAIAAPGEGALADRARREGLTVFGELRFLKPRRALSLARDVSGVRRILRTWRPDIIHSHGSQDTW